MPYMLILAAYSLLTLPSQLPTTPPETRLESKFGLKCGYNDRVLEHRNAASVAQESVANLPHPEASRKNHNELSSLQCTMTVQVREVALLLAVRLNGLQA